MKLKIVFVPRRSRIRPYKMAKALKYTGKVELILVCEESFYDSELFDGIFDEVHFFTRKNWLFRLPKAEKIYRRLNEKFGFGFGKMIRIIEKINPDIIQCYAEPYNHIVHILKNTSIPVVMSDGADFTGITQGLENLNKKVLKQEKFCFENVQGLIYKGPKEVTEYYKNNGFKINCDEMTWFDHADRDHFIDIRKKKLLTNKNELHLVYSGNISSGMHLAYCYYIPLGKILAKQKIHFHIYPNPWQYSEFKEYILLDSLESFFHFHKPISVHKLTNELSKYDYGVWIHSSIPSPRTSILKMKTGMTNKMFTYLEAGLPVIVSDSREYGADLVEQYEIGFKINDSDWSEIENIIKTNNLNRLQNNVESFRNEFSIQNTGVKLKDFYRKIIFT